MMQRIQSVFLLLAATLMGGTFLFPSLEISSAGLKFKNILFSSFGIFDVAVDYPAWGAAIFAVLSIISPLVNIFLYKKRKLQIKIGLLTILLIIVYYITAAVYVNTFTAELSAESSINILPGIILPLIALIFNSLAVSRIKKDEKLVKSLDRIR